jgi:hypothetical protein
MESILADLSKVKTILYFHIFDHLAVSLKVSEFLIENDARPFGTIFEQIIIGNN